MKSFVDRQRSVCAFLLSVATFVFASAPGASASSNLADLTWQQQNDWLLVKLLTPEDATRILGISGLTMTEGGADRICAASPSEGTKCSDRWGGGSWNDAFRGQEWPGAALPRGVAVNWSSRSEDARSMFSLSRKTFGVVENLPSQVSGFDDYGGRNPVGWSLRVSDGWVVSAHCSPTVRWSRSESKYFYPPFESKSLIDCAKRLVGEQFASLGVQPVEVKVPDPPTGVLMKPTGSIATLTWIPPFDDGGLPVAQYEASSTDGTLTCKAAPTMELVQFCTVSGIKPGVNYAFTVVARNEVGVSSPSKQSLSSQRIEQASVPRNAVAKLVGSGAALTWKRPADLGGIPVLRYVVTSSPGSMTCSTTSLSCSILGLKASTRYRFQVRAINGRGASAPAVTKWVRTATPEVVSTPEPVSIPTPAPPPEPAKPAAPIS